MIRLSEILNQINKQISYREPNFEFEWDEANRYPEFEELGKEGWVDTAKLGRVMKYSRIKNVLGNVDLDFESLDQNKKARFKSAYEKGEIEMPIAVKFSDTDYDLVAGNTRLSGLVNNGEDPIIWVVDAP